MIAAEVKFQDGPEVGQVRPQRLGTSSANFIPAEIKVVSSSVYSADGIHTCGVEPCPVSMYSVVVLQFAWP